MVRLSHHRVTTSILGQARSGNLPGMSKARLTSLSPAGGCGCKLPPRDLDVLIEPLVRGDESSLLRGTGGHSDAAAFRSFPGSSFLSVDFFTPIVDDPADWGRIAAQNALSDIWAAGGQPAVALCIAAWPGDRTIQELRDAMTAAREILEADGVILAGGHTITDPVPKLGFCIYGHSTSGDPPQGNRGARPGDQLVLTKPIGTGVAMTAHKNGRLDAESYHEVVSSMIASNGPASRVLVPASRAITDITGYGIAGHLIHMLINSDCAAIVDLKSVPTFTCVQRLVNAGIETSGGRRVWDYYRNKVAGVQSVIARTIMSDPQTSGGLLASVPSPDIPGVLDSLARVGEHGWVIGKITAGRPSIAVQ